MRLVSGRVALESVTTGGKKSSGTSALVRPTDIVKQRLKAERKATLKACFQAEREQDVLCAQQGTRFRKSYLSTLSAEELCSIARAQDWKGYSGLTKVDLVEFVFAEGNEQERGKKPSKSKQQAETPPMSESEVMALLQKYGIA